MSVSRETVSGARVGEMREVLKRVGVGLSDCRSYSGVTPSSVAIILSFLQGSSTGPVVICCNNEESAAALYHAVYYTSPTFTFYYPRLNDSSVGGFVDENQRYREELLHNLSDSNDQNIIVITTDSSLHSADIRMASSGDMLRLSPGLSLERSDFIKTLSSWGYEKVYSVENPGEFSIKGDIVDFFPIFLRNPIRIEFEFSSVASIRSFNQTSQLTLHILSSFSLSPNTSQTTQTNKKQALISVLTNPLTFSYSDEDHSLLYISNKKGGALFNVGANEINVKTLSFLAKKDSLELLMGRFSDGPVYYFGRNIGIVSKYIDPSKITHINAELIKGFYSQQLGLCCLSENDFVGGGAKSRWSPNQKALSGAGLKNLSEIVVGDYLVYQPFGVCLYRGLSIVNNAAGEQECLTLEFANDAKVYVSLDKMDLVHRYLSSGESPTLSLLGGSRWAADINKTKKSVSLVAKELLNLYAQKTKKRNFIYDQPGELYRALVDTFPFSETEDQASAINDVLGDMAIDSPMDRFVCGDVGFGKTEVALRAIMLAVTSNKQAFFLCPTTVLADQHYITCRERLEPLGVVVELLSRFKTPSEQKDIISRIAKGKVDVVVGTHRLLSDDVFAPNISLLIVDEEHRFGVKHKEKVRLIKSKIDVLSLSATPIPRTLQQSLSGIRGISKILTPPVSRRPINTLIKYFNLDVVFSQIDHELARRGQVYFLHNEIDSIPYYYDKISTKYPNHNVAFIHGRLDPKFLEKTILSFFGGKVDILICTTIIESGLDVSNANTIIINNAQNFGLSQLYQIRGRVGRGHRQATCLLLVPNASLEKNAYRRLKTIEQHTSLGSGYEISLKDLEIRGAGALFGYKQSGHISSVGFQMYCDLLKDAFDDAGGAKPDTVVFPSVVFDGDALFPDTYIEESSVRLYYYDQLSKAVNITDVNLIEKNIIDRFGRLPQEALHLIGVSRVRVLFSNSFLSLVSIRENLVEFVFSSLGFFEDVNDLLEVFYSLVGEFGGEIKLTQKKNGFIGFVVPSKSLSDGLSLVKESVPLLITFSAN